jgi:YVTN family beta-propeller protein
MADHSSNHTTLLVANKGDCSVSLVDPRSGCQFATVTEVGTIGHELAVSPQGDLAFVPIYGDSGVGKPGTDGCYVAVIDIAAQRVTGEIRFDHGVRPHCAVFGPADGQLYVTAELDHSVSVIDPATLKVVGSVPTGQPESHMLAISPDGKRGYTANVGPGTVSVLDLETRKTIDVIPISQQTQRISISVDSRSVFTADQTAPRLAVIDTVKNRVETWITLPAPGYGTAPTPDGRWLLIAIPPIDQVAIVDLVSMKTVHTIEVPAAPQEVLVPPGGGVAYVSCDSSRKVAVIRISDWMVEKLIDVGEGADGLAWAVPRK